MIDTKPGTCEFFIRVNVSSSPSESACEGAFFSGLDAMPAGCKAANRSDIVYY